MHRTFPILLIFTLLLAACASASPAPRATLAPSGETQKPAATQPPPAEPTEAVAVPLSALPPAWEGPLPILTASNQNLVFGPGQVVGAFGRGFEPGEDVAVAIVHETQGVLANKAARADGLGNAQTALYLTRSPDEPGGLPAGRYDLQLAGTLQTLRFSFQVDYAHQPAPASPACSFYPAQPAFDGQLALFCQGLEPARRYTVTASQGDLSESLSTESDPAGFLLFPLHLSSTILTPGEWTFSLDNGLPPMPVQVVPNPEAPQP